MVTTRIETESFDPIEVPLEALWGAQTARRRHFFAVKSQRMPQDVAAVCTLAIGGTDGGTGMNIHPEFDARMAKKLSAKLGLPWRRADDLFAAMTRVTTWLHSKPAKSQWNLQEVDAGVKAGAQNQCG